MSGPGRIVLRHEEKFGEKLHADLEKIAEKRVDSYHVATAPAFGDDRKLRVDYVIVPDEIEKEKNE